MARLRLLFQMPKKKSVPQEISFPVLLVLSHTSLSECRDGPGHGQVSWELHRELQVCRKEVEVVGRRDRSSFGPEESQTGKIPILESPP